MTRTPFGHNRLWPAPGAVSTRERFLGLHFKAADHLSAHPEFAWEKDILQDLDSYPWTQFQVTK
jgi:hypothetical protein